MSHLVLAEKPSMARDIAAVLGARGKADGYFFGNNYIVTYAYGHLVGLNEPGLYNSAWKSWSLDSLPIIPEHFEYSVSESGKRQFSVIKKLFNSGVESVINACDAGREGELIFWLICEQAAPHLNLTVKRLWISSLTEDAIRAGFRNLRPSDEFSGLLHAAKLRQIADWLVGINATRAQTLVARESGGSGGYSIGRVQTPTLAIIVTRDMEIENFTPVPYFEIQNSYIVGGHSFAARMIDIQTKGFYRFDTEGEARLAYEKVNAFRQTEIYALDKRETQAQPPLLFDLTTLQRTANVIYSMSAAKTLELAQSLYEKKCITYPRTASRYLTKDVALAAREWLGGLPTTYTPFVTQINDNSYALGNRFVADDKVSDHHAIIPTGESAKNSASLSDDEKRILDLIVRRFLAVFFPPARDERTLVVIKQADYYFLARGAVELDKGWRVLDVSGGDSVLNKENEDDEDGSTDSQKLPSIERDSVVTFDESHVLSKLTRQPNRLTENTLLQAMETAGKYVADVTLREAMKESGIGTSATRDSIIETLIKRGYCVRNKRFIRSTPRGGEIIKRLGQSMSLLTSPVLTGQWEAALSKIENGKLAPEVFKNNIGELARSVVEQIKSQTTIINGDSGKTLDFGLIEGRLKCPLCASRGNCNNYLIPFNYEKRKLARCAQPRDLCGYITVQPQNKNHIVKFESSNCPVCSSSVMTFNVSRAGAFYLKCYAKECSGVIFFENRKKKSKSLNSGGKFESS